jgi:hypothetical protein
MTHKNSTPFELRLEMLKMAQNYFESQMSIAREAATQSWQASVSLAQEVGKSAVPELKMPPMYSVDDITKMADKFNEFVSGITKK